MTKLKNQDKKNIADVLALTPLQEGLLFHYLKDPESDYYFEQLRIRISGILHTGVFEQAWNTVVETNEMLRTVFRWEKLDNPVQLILKEYPVRWKYYDLTSENDSEAEKRFEQILFADWKEKFDLRDVPFRVTLCKIAAGSFEMIISNHHILYDGWSNGIILKEFFNVYRDIIQDRKAIKPVKTHFKEFIEYLQRRDKEQERQFWQEYLAGFEGRTEISAGRKDCRGEDYSADIYSIRLPAHMTNSLEMITRSNRVSAAAVLYSTWGLLLQRYCNSEDVIFGTTVSGRSAKIKAIEEVVGLFINTLPLRVQTHDTEKVADLLYRVNHMLQIREAYENTSPADIKKYSKTGSKGELFDSILVIENYPLEVHLTGTIGDFRIDSHSLKEAAHYNLTIVISLLAGIEITFNYFKNLWEEEMIRRMANHFLSILEQITILSDRKCFQIEMLSQEEKRQLLGEFNDPDADFPRDKTIHQLFVEQVEKLPDRIALIGDSDEEDKKGGHLSYRELDKRSSRLAGLLIKKGVRIDNIVGIMMQRSLEMVIGILGILKSGGVYLPIDPSYPSARIDYLLKDSAAKITIGISEEWKSEKAGEKDFASDSSSLAYVIYTSGSTGNPKGVIVEHRAVVNLLYAMQKQCPFCPTDTYLFKTSCVFDVSVTELFGWFMSGGKLAVLEKGGEKDPELIFAWVERNKVTHINFVPSMFNIFIEHVTMENKNRLSSLKYLILAGEALLPVLVKKFKNLGTGISMENIYGPTEATVYSSRYSLSEWQGNGSIPIGKPLPNI
ncbi:MAG TPA: condensation domain-containing protein, partial [Candidatus Kapabacteria bacterium]|nr:condensation domain-containing protein [Candidatus Kapabacteria bacterium]